jgi:hypothetical protein
VFSDADIEHELPSSDALGDAGNIIMLNGDVGTYYLRTRVELAYIQGRIFDLLHSSRARKITATERQGRVSRCRSMLSDWYRKMPPGFRQDVVVDGLPRRSAQLIAALYNTYLLSLFILHGLHQESKSLVMRVRSHAFGSQDQEPIQRLHPYSDCQNPLPAAWADCVESSRACLKLFTAVGQTDYYVW